MVDVGSHECWMSVHRTSQSLSIRAGARLPPTLGRVWHPWGCPYSTSPVPALLRGKEKPWSLRGHGETVISQGLPQALPSPAAQH